MNGMINWFARNSVAANLLMVFIIVSGIIALFNVRGETFPELSLDMVNVEVPYLGAAPEEVEEAVCIRIEEAIHGIDGIKQITSTASGGMGTVLVEVELGSDTRTVLDDIKNRVDAIDTFPEETEKPIIREMLARNQVIDVAISGQTDEFTLKALAERVRDDLSAIPQISQVELVSARPYEISIEVSELALRRYGLTFDDVARAVRRSSLDLPGGIGPERERGDPPQNDRASLSRRGVRGPDPAGTRRRHAITFGRHCDRRRWVRGDRSIRAVRRRADDPHLGLSHR